MPKILPATIPDEEIDATDEPIAPVCRWWNELNANRGDRAELRRCRSIDEVQWSEPYHRLRLRLHKNGTKPGPEQLAFTAGILVHVKRHSGEVPSVARRMGKSREGQSSPQVSLSRFKRFIRIETRSDVYAPLVRLVRSIEVAHIPLLARDLYYWGPKTRKQWAADYYELALDEA